MDPAKSLSGLERNHLFLNREAKSYSDISGLSGLDGLADARSFAVLDYDRDGWPDIALANASSPLFQLFRNRLGERESNASKQSAVIAVRLVGGNWTAKPSSDYSSRDAYGAVVEVEAGGTRFVRELRAGEGFAAQNSDTLLIGLGSVKTVDRLTVRWPAGKRQSIETVAANALVTVYERADQSPSGSGFEQEAYVRSATSAGAVEKDPARRIDVVPPASAANASQAELRLITTMATWCEKCRGELPQVALLRKTFNTDELALFGVPVDKEDTPDKLRTYREEAQPAYEILDGLSEKQIDSVSSVVREQLRIDVLPASILTDASGNILGTFWGVPTVSTIRSLRAATNSRR